jgi:hypothetical protein
MRGFSGGWLLAIALAVGVLGPGVSLARAQEGGWSAADAAALKGYTLTMDKLRQTSEAMIAFDRLDVARDDDDDDGTSQSINGMMTRINAVPQARAILAKEKLTTRDYVMTMLVSTHAASVALVEESGQTASGLPVSRAQVEFYKANKAEIDKMFARRKAASQPEDSEEDEE